jgi:hypothetical protein
MLMKITVQLVIERGDGSTVVTEVTTLERAELTNETLGLTLAEGKAILAQLQQAVVAQQAAAYVTTQQTCPTCGAPRRCKGHHQIVVRSLFGTLRIDSPRFRRCACQPADSPGSNSPLAERLVERTTPQRREEGSQVGGPPALRGDGRCALRGATPSGQPSHGLSTCPASG